MLDFAQASVHTPIDKPRKADRWRPADRVVWSDVTLDFDKTNPGFQFVGYDRLDTGYEVIDHGKVTRTFNWGFSSSSSADASLGSNAASTGNSSTTGNSAGLDFGASVEGTAGASSCAWFARGAWASI